MKMELRRVDCKFRSYDILFMMDCTPLGKIGEILHCVKILGVAVKSVNEFRIYGHKITNAPEVLRCTDIFYF